MSRLRSASLSAVPAQRHTISPFRHRFSTLFLPLSEKAQGVVIHENFSDFENMETGEKGYGIDEYLINPA